MTARRHLYLITDHPDDDKVGTVIGRSTRFTNGKKNEERSVQKRNLDTGRTYVQFVVGLGYYDFEDEDVIDDRLGDVVDEKLTEIDDKHIERAGLDPQEVAA